MAKIKITISASAVDSALSDEVVPVLSSAVDSTNRAAILAGSGWRAFSDQACTSQIGLKEVYTSATAFRYDIAAASLSALSDTDIYLEDGNGATADIDPYPASYYSRYPLAENANDSTDNARNLTGSAGFTAGGGTGPDGIIPSTVLTDDYADTNDSTLIALPQTHDLSVSAWVKPDSVNSAAAIAFEGIDDLLVYPIDTILGQGGGRLFWRDLGGSIINETGADNSGVWHFISFTTSAPRNHELFRNAVSIGSTTVLGDAGPFSNFRIGSFTTSSQFFNGEMANVTVSNARSVASINLEYLLTGPDAATYITAAAVATFNAAWAAQSNVLIGAA